MPASTPAPAPEVAEVSAPARLAAAIDAVAATYGPGLVGSLLVGLCTAKAIAYARRLPFLGVNHLEGHLLSVRLELQADCYAGVWARNAASVSNGEVALEAGDLEAGMQTASAIGDDTLQRRQGGQVQPDGFTHGTSAQRVEWLRRGYESGDPAACDTFRAL
jgi:tRNA A37 threonylcarbamoyladenosine modification protein TsaB